MSSQYFQRNSGLPLLLKIGLLILAVYLVYLALKVFAVLLTALFAILKILVPIAIVALVIAFLLRFLFGIRVFPFHRRNPDYYRR